MDRSVIHSQIFPLLLCSLSLCSIGKGANKSHRDGRPGVPSTRCGRLDNITVHIGLGKVPLVRGMDPRDEVGGGSEGSGPMSGYN